MSGAGPTKVASAPKTVASEPASKMSSVKMEASATAAPAGNASEPAANGGASAPTAADFSQWAAAAAFVVPPDPGAPNHGRTRVSPAPFE